MTQKWKEDVLAKVPEGKTIIVNYWLARITLDVIGEGTSHPISCITMQ